MTDTTLRDLQYDLRKLFGDDYNIDSVFGEALAQIAHEGRLPPSITPGDLAPMCEDLDTTLFAFAKRASKLECTHVPLYTQIISFKVKEVIDSLTGSLTDCLKDEQRILDCLEVVGRIHAFSLVESLHTKLNTKCKAHVYETQLKELSTIQDLKGLEALAVRARELAAGVLNEMKPLHRTYAESFVNPEETVESIIPTVMVLATLAIVQSLWADLARTLEGRLRRDLWVPVKVGE